MEQNFLISIIIPVYNVEKYLNRCIESIINQTYKNLEIILVDDGSTDNSGKICDEYALKDNRIKVIHKQNGGVSSARNKGLEVATGEYIGFVDSDDYIEKDMYELLLSTIIETKSQVVVCNWFKGTESNWIENKNFPTKEKLTKTEALESFYWCMFSWNKLFNRRVIENIRFLESCSCGEDTLFVFNIFIKLEQIYCINLPKYYYRINTNSILHSRIFKKSFLDYIKILDTEIRFAKENNLYELTNKLYNAKLYVATTWLIFIAAQKSKDLDSAKILLQYVRQNLFVFLKTKGKISKKCFVLIACVNFKLASLIYRLLLKLKISR